LFFLPRELHRVISGHYVVHLNFLCYLLTCAVILYFESRQFRLGQSLRIFSTDLFFFLDLIFLTQSQSLSSLVIGLSLLYEFGETASFHYTQSGITIRSASAINLPYAFQEMQFYAIAAGVVIFSIIDASHFPLGRKLMIPIRTSVISLAFVCELVCAFMFIQDKLDVLYPFRWSSRTRTNMSARIL
jgi:hypothetical protein